MGKRIYTCYVKLYPEKVQADEAITGNKKDVLAWMKAKFGKLSEAELEQAEAFFYDGDCTEFRLADGRPVFLAELLEDDDGPEEDGPEGEDLDDPEEEGPEEEDVTGPDAKYIVGEDLNDPEEEGPEEEDDTKQEREMAEQARKRREEEERADRERREKERQQQLAEQERLRKEAEKVAAAKLEAERAQREAAEAKAAAELAKKETELKSSQAKMQSELPEQHKELAQSAVVKSPQKRWLFIVLGLLGGWLGLHLAYARRWVLFALFWVSAIAFFAVVPDGAKSGPAQTPFALAVVALWIGGAFFIRKDGKKRRLS